MSFWDYLKPWETIPEALREAKGNLNSEGKRRHDSFLGPIGKVADPMTPLLGKKYANFMHGTIPRELNRAMEPAVQFGHNLNPLYHYGKQTGNETLNKIHGLGSNKGADILGLVAGSIFAGGALGGAGAGAGGSGGTAGGAAGSSSLGGTGWSAGQLGTVNGILPEAGASAGTWTPASAAGGGGKGGAGALQRGMGMPGMQPGGLGQQQSAPPQAPPSAAMTPAQQRRDKFMSSVNPYYSQLGAQEQEAARKRMMLAMMSNMINKKPAVYGLGQLDEVVNTAYERSERERSRTLQEQDRERQAERDRVSDERWQQQQEQERQRYELAVEQQKRLEESAKATQEAQKRELELAEERARIARENQQFEMKNRQRLAELTRKMQTGQLTEAEQIEYATLGGSPYAIDPKRRSTSGLGQWDLGANNGMLTTEEILRAGMGQR